jgi:hypothetical protein
MTSKFGAWEKREIYPEHLLENIMKGNYMGAIGIDGEII